MSTKDHEPVELEVGIEVYIGPPPPPGKIKTLWTVMEIDALGNAKMIAVHNPRLHRNYPNVNILVGMLFRRDGRMIKGKINERQPLPPERRPARFHGRSL